MAQIVGYCKDQTTAVHLLLTFIPPCYVAPCHHNMARPRVEDEGDGLRIWRIAVNILNKQS
jgi:hypothetical protein